MNNSCQKKNCGVNDVLCDDCLKKFCESGIFAEPEKIIKCSKQGCSVNDVLCDDCFNNHSISQQMGYLQLNDIETEVRNSLNLFSENPEKFIEELLNHLEYSPKNVITMNQNGEQHFNQCWISTTLILLQHWFESEGFITGSSVSSLCNLFESYGEAKYIMVLIACIINNKQKGTVFKNTVETYAKLFVLFNNIVLKAPKEFNNPTEPLMIGKYNCVQQVLRSFNYFGLNVELIDKLSSDCEDTDKTNVIICFNNRDAKIPFDGCISNNNYRDLKINFVVVLEGVHYISFKRSGEKWEKINSFNLENSKEYSTDEINQERIVAIQASI